MKLIAQICLFSGFALALLAINSGFLSGVKVEIENLGPATMKNVSVNVTGASYRIDDIRTGTSNWVKVKPRGESSISIKHTDKTGKQHTLSIDTYIESGYSGKITLQVKNGKIINVKQNIKPTLIG